MNYTCLQCVSYKPEEATFDTEQEAEEHLLFFHPRRFLALYRAQVYGEPTQLPPGIESALYNQADGIKR